MLFRGAYAYLSNMYTCDIPCVIRGQHYRFRCAEALFQAMKCPERAREFESLDGPSSKRLGKCVKLRPDWDEIKLEVMTQVIQAKFGQNPALARKLLATGDLELVETNSWGDTYWGTCQGKGKNHLGKILMQERARLAALAQPADKTA